MRNRSLQVIAFGTIVAVSGIRVTAQQPAQLTVRLSIDQDGGLSDTQLGLVVDEVRAIWSEVGVAVVSGRYGEGSPADGASISLRILRLAAPIRDGGERILAWVTPTASGRAAPLLFVSLPGVTDAVMGTEALGRSVSKLTHTLQDRLIARAIGRVTAHELGHYLLQNAHQDRGLMRPAYTSSDLVGGWIDPFRVLPADRDLFRKEIAQLVLLQSAF
jgi:hypothetical protein